MEDRESAPVERQALSAKTYDAFVSFAEEDRDWAEGFLLEAFSASQVRYCTVADFPAGMPLLEAVSRAIEASDRIVLVVSPAYVADHIQQIVSVLSQYFGVEQGTWPVIPILLGSTPLP